MPVEGRRRRNWGTYMASRQHLLGNVLDAPLVFGLTALWALGVDVFQICLEELDVPAICEADIFVLADLLPLPVGIAELVEESATEVGGVGDICHLVHLIRQCELDEVTETRKGNMLEAFGPCELTKSLSIGPDITIRDPKKICASMSVSMRTVQVCPTAFSHTIVYETIGDDG